MMPLFVDPMPFPSQVINLVSNLPPVTTSLQFGAAIATDSWVRSSFTTGSDNYGYILSSVTLQFRQNAADANLFVRLYEDKEDEPGVLGDLITSFTNPDSISTTFPNGANTTFALTTPQILDANTTYWLVVGISGNSGGLYSWRATDSGDQTGEPGWSIGDSDPYYALFSGNQGGTWNIFTGAKAFQFSINGQSYPLYPSNILLFLSGNGVNNSTNILDSSSYSRTLTRYGNTLINTAESRLGNGCIELDGNGDYLEFDYTPNFSFSGEFRVEAWIKAKVLSGSQVIISKDTFGVNFDFSILIVNNNRLVVYTNRTLQNLTVLVPTLNIGVWYKIVFERRLVSGILTNTIYLNDIAYGSNTMGITNDSQVKLTIGAYSWNNPNAFFNGFIEDLIITSPL